MGSILYYKEKIEEINKRLDELSRQESKLLEEKETLTESWQNLCSHPKEYIKITNMYYEDDYGKRIRNDERDYTYKCTACNKYIEDLK